MSSQFYDVEYIPYRGYDKSAEPYKTKIWLSPLEKHSECYTESFPKAFVSHIKKFSFIRILSLLNPL